MGPRQHTMHSKRERPRQLRSVTQVEPARTSPGGQCHSKVEGLAGLAVVRRGVGDGGGGVDESESLGKWVGGLDGEGRILEGAAQLDWAEGDAWGRGEGGGEGEEVGEREGRGRGRLPHAPTRHTRHTHTAHTAHTHGTHPLA